MDLAAQCASDRGSLTLDHVEARPKASGGPRVQIVDDDEATCKTLALLLRLSGFEAEFVLTGADALSCALAAPPDAVVCDVHLADDDIPGFVVLTSLRARHPDLPIIAMTGWYLADEHEVEARSLGVTDYLFKPVDDSELLASLHRALAGLPSGQRSQSRARPAEGERGTSRDGRAAVATNGENVGGELAAAESAFISSRLRQMVRSLRRAFPTVWDDVIAEQVEDTLLQFLAKVKRGIWPARGSLDGHLRLAAWRNVRDRIQAAGRRAAYEAAYARERAQSSRDWVHSLTDLDELLTLAQTAAEREALRRWGEDERPLRIAEVLGLSHLPISEQLREVKRFKDRVKKRARRGHPPHAHG
jgi:DNA-binding response OmpR family regulator